MSMSPRINQEECLRRFKEKHGDKYDYNQVKYESTSAKVIIICPKHGQFTQQPIEHWKGRGCRKCGNEAKLKWTETEHEFIVQNYSKLGCYACAEQLGKTYESVRARASDFKIRSHLYQRIETYKELPPHLWKQLLHNADMRNLPVEIDREYIWDIYLKQNKKCALTGWDIAFVLERGKTTASVDRIDSSLGYLKGNIQIVHKWVNRAKVNYDELMFYDMCKSIHEYRNNDFEYEEKVEEWDIWNDTMRIMIKRCLGRPQKQPDFTEELIFGYVIPDKPADIP